MDLVSTFILLFYVFFILLTVLHRLFLLVCNEWTFDLFTLFLFNKNSVGLILFQILHPRSTALHDFIYNAYRLISLLVLLHGIIIYFAVETSW